MQIAGNMPDELAKSRFLLPIGAVGGEKRIFGAGERPFVSVLEIRPGKGVLIIGRCGFHPDRIPVVAAALVVEAKQPVEPLALALQPDFLSELVVPGGAFDDAEVVPLLVRGIGRRHRHDAVLRVIDAQASGGIHPEPRVVGGVRPAFASPGVVVLEIHRGIQRVFVGAVEETGGRNELGEAKVSLNRQRIQIPLVAPIVLVERDRLQVADIGVVIVCPLGLVFRIAVAEGRRPIVVDVPARLNPQGQEIHRIPVVLHHLGIVQGAPIGPLGASDSGAVPCIRRVAEHIVDVAAVSRRLRGDANGEHIIDQRRIEHAGDAVAHAAFPAGAEVRVNIGLEAARVRLIGVDAQRAGLRGGAVQCALGAGQGFHMIDVHHADVRLRAGLADRYLVEIDGSAGLGDEVVNAGADAAEADVVVARLGEVQPGHARNHAGVVFRIQCADLLEHVFGDGLNAGRNVLNVLFPLARRDDDFLDRIPGAFIRRILRRGSRRAGQRGRGGGDGRGNRADGKRSSVVHLHLSSLTVEARQFPPILCRGYFFATPMADFFRIFGELQA